MPFFIGNEKSLLEIIMCILMIQLGNFVEQRIAVEETILSEDSEGPHSDHEEECAEFGEGEEREGDVTMVQSMKMRQAQQAKQKQRLRPRKKLKILIGEH